MSHSKGTAATRVILEIPDALDPTAADRKYTEPLRQCLLDRRVGTISLVEQGKPKTPEEFSRIITVQLTDYDAGMAAIQEFLVITGAPVGTMIHSYDSDGHSRDIFALGPPEHDG